MTDENENHLSPTPFNSLCCTVNFPVLTRGRAEEFTKCVGKVAAAVVAYLGANGLDRDICLGQHARSGA